MATILLVDDDRVLSSALARYLEREGHIVHVADDGSAALALLQTVVPDLAIIDLFLPQLNGRAFLKILRATASGAHLPVVAISGMGVNYLRATSEADVVLAKPFHLGHLGTIVSQLLTEN